MRRLFATLASVAIATIGLTAPAHAANPTDIVPAPADLTILPVTEGASTDVSKVYIDFELVGGDSNYRCAVSSGSLPTGMSLDATGCYIKGQTTTVETATFTLDVQDTGSANAVVLQKSYSISVEAYSLQNDYLRFGDGGNHSISPSGALQQPWYKSPVDSNWYPLIYEDPDGYSVDLAVGFGTGGNWWNENTDVFDLTQNLMEDVDDADLKIIGWSVDKTGFTETSEASGVKLGYGTLVAETTFKTADSVSFTVKNTYLLGQTDSFVKAETSVKQNSGGDWSNAYLWVGTRDDFVGTDDDPDKNKGNITSNGFTATTNQADVANAIQATSAAEGALFYSTAEGANSVTDECCDWENVTNLDPVNSPLQALDEDGAYGVAIPLGTLTTGTYSSVSTWYFAGGDLDDLGDVGKAIAVSSGVGTATPPPYTGPIIRDVGNDSQAGPFSIGSKQQVTVSGDRLSTVTKAFIDGKECEIVSTADGELVITTPDGLTEGVYDLVIYSSIGNLTYLDAFRVTAATVAAGNYGDVKAWTQRINDTQAKVYVKYPTIGEKVRISHQTGGSGSYETIFVKTIASESDSALTVNANGSYIVRTIDLEDINRIRVTVGDDTLVQVRNNQ